MAQSLSCNSEADRMFKKTFTFQPNHEWSVPSLDTWNSEKTWVLEALQGRKHELNSVKSLLNDKGVLWQKHTKAINKAGLIQNVVKKLVKPEFLTQAWCKFYEILCLFPIVSSDVECFRSFHLCEAPGAFVSALNYYLCLNNWNLPWEWYANTLNPYYEGHSVKHAIVDDRLLFHTLKNWHFGKDNTGDVLSPSYLSDLKRFLSKKGEFNLVTADGSISCSDNPAEQEIIVADLQFSEVLIALNSLAPGGAFVMKKFTLFECISVCVMYLLNCLFKEVHVFKPVTSKSGNSEIYVVCLGYKKMEDFSSFSELLHQQLYLSDVALFPQSSIPVSFIEQLHQCCDMFMGYQVSSINENIELFCNMTAEKQSRIDEVKDQCVSLFLQKYPLEFLPPDQYCRLSTGKHKNVMTAYGGYTNDLRTLYHSVLGSTFEKIEQYKHMGWEESLLDIESRFDSCFPISTKRQLHEPCWIPIWKEILQTTKFTKSYKNWVVTGKGYNVIENSKFGNPLLLLLWNELVKRDQQVLPQNHISNNRFNWDWDSFKDIAEDCENLEKAEVILDVQVAGKACSSVATSLKSCINKDSEVHVFCFGDSSAESYRDRMKIVVIDMTSWSMDSFNFEINVKHNFVEALLSVIPALKYGDSLVICFPSLLTRFMVGILFLLLSLFVQSMTLLPLDISSTLTGQIWILQNFQKPFWTSLLLQCLKYISELKEGCEDTVLEVVPITNICSGQFYNHLLDVNHTFMLQRLRSLIRTEKARLKT